MNISGNTVLITGGTSGIGRALAEFFYHQGNKVIIAGRRQLLLDEIISAHPGMIGKQLDVRDLDKITLFVKDISEHYPELNVLINNAGISRAEDLTSDSIGLSDAHSIIETNIFSVLHLTAGFLPLLKNQKASTMITTTSGLAFVPSAAYPTYCASKAFLHSWLQSLRFQLRKTNIEVLELAPPYVQTDLTGAAQATDPNAMPLSDFMEEVIQILKDKNYINGEILVKRAQTERLDERNNEYEIVFARHNR